MLSGGSGIRTHVGLHQTCFQDMHLQPLGHPSQDPAVFRGGGDFTIYIYHTNLLYVIIYRIFTMTSKIADTKMIIQINDDLVTWIEGFLIDRKARGLTENTLLFYTRKLKQFNEFAETQAVSRL